MRGGMKEGGGEYYKALDKQREQRQQSQLKLIGQALDEIRVSPERAEEIRGKYAATYARDVWSLRTHTFDKRNPWEDVNFLDVFPYATIKAESKDAGKWIAVEAKEKDGHTLALLTRVYQKDLEGVSKSGKYPVYPPETAKRMKAEPIHDTGEYATVPVEKLYQVAAAQEFLDALDATITPSASNMLVEHKKAA